MKQLIIGIYDGGYDFSINKLKIDKNTISTRILHRHEFEDINKKINRKLRNLANIIHKEFNDDIIHYLKHHNYFNEYDSILIVEDSWVTIVK